jgi:hypothetical protein
MYTFKELISLYHKINENDIDYFNNRYYINLYNNIQTDIDNETILESIVINSINYNMNKINKIYIIIPLIYTITIYLGFKQFICMIK